MRMCFLLIYVLSLFVNNNLHFGVRALCIGRLSRLGFSITNLLVTQNTCLAQLHVLNHSLYSKLHNRQGFLSLFTMVSSD